MKALTYLVAGLMCIAATAATSCGGSAQPRCDVNIPLDQATADTLNQQKNALTDSLENSKSVLENVPEDKFRWSFIPEIPTAECRNPQLQNPIDSSNHVEMDVCSRFKIFRNFMKGVLAVFCIMGCVNEIRAALAAKG